ncbi:hypothetical protein QJS10_CPA07g00859 [Acorus calamus]|uniref:MYB transcription factor n=1 Tax=Acorus calamus TaxID=4465 RepID=A0AAV9EGE5_ACOCL|nr:hypothetical protein QJS10_CPA07g00859 [Acorus calamus]
MARRSGRARAWGISPLLPPPPRPGLPVSPAEHAGERSTVAGGYVSDDAAHGSGSSNRGRKKGIPWTEEEHCMFLVGLKKLGKGDWRGIARDYVVSRTPTQVASHAQKYFIRQTNSTRRKRRPSLFDMVSEASQPAVEESLHHHSPSPEPETAYPPLPPSNLSLDQEPEPMEAEATMELNETPPQPKFPPMIPAFYLPYIPRPIPIWPVLPFNTENKNQETHVIKPTPVLKETINVDDIVGMSNRLSLGSLTLKLHSSPSRPSAFHASRGQSSSTSAIHAV